jgi:hypothetical protein
VTLTWTGVYLRTVPRLSVDSSGLTGGTNPRMTLATTTEAAGNGGYGYVEAGTQEVWERDAKGAAIDRYLYVAATTGTGNYRISVFR